ncbi:MAG: replication-associated recombination protein A [Oscillospiraceae bacterium]|jgi:putative ATPase|nr:replication-associated recombination protein A [Oscillospiraceae bacterium]
MPAPLADRLRPQSLDDIVGQKHLLGQGSALRNIILSGTLPNLIFYGPSGVGKTTLAGIIALSTNRTLRKLNGTNASISDIKDIVAQLDTLAAPNGVLLYLDEIQYFNKKQQQSLLEYIENGKITLIASTTENPYFYIYNAILSRSTVFEFKTVEPGEIEVSVIRAFDFLRDETGDGYKLEKGVSKYIASACGGDVRKAINAVELCFLTAQPKNKTRTITLQNAKELTQRSAMKYDRDGDEHYDILSAFQKSMRGSDANAALHYLARLLEAGDLASATRRLMVCACEDVGLAYPLIIPIVKSAVDAAFQVGLPEARIPLADAVVLVCNSPKSNSAYIAIDKAIGDVRKGKTGPIPRHLQNVHFDGEDNENKGQFYNYPHEYKNHWICQRYLPDDIKDASYYQYGENRNEQAAKEYWDKIKGL